MISHLETAGIVEAHPLLDVLPVVREACRIEGAKCQLRRALGQPYSTDHDTLTDDLIPQVGFEVSP